MFPHLPPALAPAPTIFHICGYLCPKCGPHFPNFPTFVAQAKIVLSPHTSPTPTPPPPGTLPPAVCTPPPYPPPGMPICARFPTANRFMSGVLDGTRTVRGHRRRRPPRRPGRWTWPMCGWCRASTTRPGSSPRRGAAGRPCSWPTRTSGPEYPFEAPAAAAPGGAQPMNNMGGLGKQKQKHTHKNNIGGLGKEKHTHERPRKEAHAQGSTRVNESVNNTTNDGAEVFFSRHPPRSAITVDSGAEDGGVATAEGPPGAAGPQEMGHEIQKSRGSARGVRAGRVVDRPAAHGLQTAWRKRLLAPSAT
jgi:hypothetical protein